MTMRSMPPASSHFAESPVPAPPPMIGTRRATMSVSFARMIFRSIRGMAFSVGDFTICVNERCRECLIVDVERQSNGAALVRLSEIVQQCFKQSGVRRGVVERLTRRVQGRDTVLWNEETELPIATVE